MIKKILSYSLVLFLLWGCTKDNDKKIDSANNAILFSVSTESSESSTISKSSSQLIELTPSVTNIYEFQTNNEKIGELFLIEESIENQTNPFEQTDYSDTKSVRVSDLSEYGEFGLWAVGLTSEDVSSDYYEINSPTTYFSNVKYTKTSGNMYAATSERTWPSNSPTKQIKFFAVAPYSGSGTSFSISVKAPMLSITVPTTIAQQKDVLAAISQTYPDNYKNTIPLTFKHLLSSIKIIRGATVIPELVIKKVRFTNIYSSANYKINSGTGEWTLSSKSSAKTFELTPNWSAAGTVEGDVIVGGNSDNNTLFMIPQTLGSSAQIELDIEIDGQASTLTKSLEGSEWKQGHIVTYKIQKDYDDIYILEVTPSTITKSYVGGEESYSVKSYKQRGSVKTPITWKTQINTGTVGSPVWVDLTSSNAPSWITQFTSTATPADDAATAYTAKLAPTVPTFSPNSHTSTLRGRASVGSQSNPIDLSTLTLPELNGARTSIPQSTANCYVVSAPGWYKIPMVYGNSISWGNTNSDAYMARLVESPNPNVLFNFVDHTGSPISQPWVSVAYTINDAKLLWQDELNLVSNISIISASSNKNYIKFYVDPDFIHQGNAVIAAYDNDNKIAWSWHIWVTDFDLTPIKITGPVGYNMTDVLPVNIGTCGDINSFSLNAQEARNYAAAEAKYRIVQIVDGQIVGTPQPLTISKTALTTPSQPQNNTYYQWGRKDPMLPMVGIPGTNIASEQKFKDYYGHGGELNDGSWGEASLGADATSLKNYIQNPGKFNTTPFVVGSTNIFGMERTYYNLWDINNATIDSYTSANQVDIEYRKSVYDPSPGEFYVPRPAAFEIFAVNNNISSVIDNPSNFNADLSSSYDLVRGYYFYPLKDRQGTPLLFFPAMGSIDSASQRAQWYRYGSHGYYYFSVPCGTYCENSYLMNFDSSYIRIFTNGEKQDAKSIRPVIFGGKGSVLPST